jgi:hypothetical protein
LTIEWSPAEAELKRVELITVYAMIAILFYFLAVAKH